MLPVLVTALLLAPGTSLDWQQKTCGDHYIAPTDSSWGTSLDLIIDYVVSAPIFIKMDAEANDFDIASITIFGPSGTSITSPYSEVNRQKYITLELSDDNVNNFDVNKTVYFYFPANDNVTSGTWDVQIV